MGKWELGIWEFHLLRIRISMPQRGAMLEILIDCDLNFYPPSSALTAHQTFRQDFPCARSATYLNANPRGISHKGEVYAVRRISPPAGEIISPYGREFLRPIRIEPVRASMPSRSSNDSGGHLFLQKSFGDFAFFS